MKTAALNSFLKFYVMRRTEIDLYGIAHVKVDFIPVLKMCVLTLLGKFVWTTIFDTSGTLEHQLSTCTIQKYFEIFFIHWSQ